jgi:hypothetical protein
VASNLLFMLSMSEPERPFDASCSAHMANRAIIGSAPGLFPAFVAGHFACSRIVVVDWSRIPWRADAGPCVCAQ